MRFYEHPIPIELDQPSIDQLIACTPYKSVGGELVRVYKYDAAYALAPTIAQFMKWHIQKPLHVDMLVPVPLFKKRQRERGFNQAELLAKRLSKMWNIPMLHALQRVKATTPQAELSREQRLTHLQEVFTVSRKINFEALSGKTICLIDDVATTGTTLNECAKILKAAHAQSVIGIVFAHGS